MVKDPRTPIITRRDAEYGNPHARNELFFGNWGPGKLRHIPHYNGIADDQKEKMALAYAASDGRQLRNQRQHLRMLATTVPEQRSGRIKFVCTICAKRIGCVEASTPARNDDGERIVGKRDHLACQKPVATGDDS